MAIIDKKLIHFKKWNTFISSEGVNGNYTTPSTNATSTSPALYGQIKETSIVFIQDVQKIWTHGKLYDCSTPDLSAYLTAEDLATLNAFMNNSSVSKDGETLTVEINGSTQSLTNTWRSISNKTNGTSSTISASEKAVKAAYDLAASKTSNTGTVTSVTPGTGLTGASSDAAITTSGTINLKTAGTSEIGGIKVATVGTAASGANTTVNANKFAVHVDSDGLGYVAIPAYTNNSGDITGVTAGSGLTGGATSGNATLNVGAGTGITVAADSVSVNLKDATALTVDATAATTTSGRVYPVAVDKSGYLAVNVPWKNDDTKSFTITASANDDDVVVLSGTNGTNKVTYTASHAKTFGNTTAPYTAKYTSGNSTTSISGYGSSATIKIPQITVDEYGHVRAGADESVTITMPSEQTIPTLSGGASATTGKYVSGVTVSGHKVTVTKGTLPTIPTTLKNPNSLTFGNKSYDGSSAQTITAADLGLDSALKFHGTSKTAITDGSKTQTVTLSDNTQHTAENGCVLFYGNKEFVWNGSSWEELGNEGNYKVKQTAVSSPSASGSTAAFIDTISQNTNGVITVTKKNLAAATTSVIGGLKLYNAAKTTAISPNSATTTSGRYYAVELDKDGKAFVNVPWTDTDTNTHYTSKNIVGTSSTATSNGAVTGTGGVYLNHLEESTVKSTHKIVGAGSVKVTSDASGNITITGSAHPTSLPASDVYAWAKASSKPTYTKSEVGLGNVDNTADSAKSVKSAARLTTARTIWGQSFNGTGNVSGSMTGVSDITMTGNIKMGDATISYDSTQKCIKFSF